MSEGNPNQGFDNYAKEFALRIELLRAAGQWQKDLAEAQLTQAKTLDQLERTRTTHLVNDSLRRALREIEIAEHKAEVDRASMERRFEALQWVIAGRKPVDLNTFYDRIKAIAWLVSRGHNAAVLFDPLPAGCRTVDNFVSLSQVHPESEAPPDNVDNLAELVEWMQTRLQYFRNGSQVHQLFAESVNKLADVQAALVVDLQSRLDAARKGTYEKLHELKSFLGLSN
jgi:hypothetical protein